jgi:conjugal transfer pilus assembly protein TraF
MKFLLLLWLIVPLAYGEISFEQDKTAGWFWYKEKHAPQKQVRKISAPKQVALDKEQLERALRTAIKAPTDANIVEFIKIRNKIMDESYNFGLRLHQVNLMHPELDQLTTYPSNGSAKAIYQKQRQQQIEQKILALAKTHGLFYIFASHCPYCHVFAKTVQSFADKFNWSVLPITLDGKGLPEFPYARRDNGMASKLQIKNIPALIMVEPTGEKIFPIATGVISEEDIMERIDLLTRKPL